MNKFTPFHEWLSKQQNRKSPLGDWARTAARDTNFPKELTGLDGLLVYLRSTQATPTQIATARTAWLTYAREQR